MSTSTSTKKSQGTLVEEALQQYGDTSSLELIDIGINLADPSFDEVRCCRKSFPIQLMLLAQANITVQHRGLRHATYQRHVLPNRSLVQKLAGVTYAGYTAFCRHFDPRECAACKSY